MKWHDHWRARNAAKALAKHRKALSREPIISKTIEIANSIGRPDLVEGL